MIFSYSGIQQDTLRSQNNISPDSVRFVTDSTIVAVPVDSSVTEESVPISDSASVPAHSDDHTEIILTEDIVSPSTITVKSDHINHKPEFLITGIGSSDNKRFPFLFIEKNRKINAGTGSPLIRQLRSGKELPGQSFKEDWMVFVILVVAFLYSLLRITSARVLPLSGRLFLFKGINDPSLREINPVSGWKSIVLNLISFSVITLFLYDTAVYYQLIPYGLKGIAAWVLAFVFLVSAVIIRHILCILTGLISEGEEIFEEYLVTVYLSYRVVAVLLFILVVLISYTEILPVRITVPAGLTLFGIMYIFRVIKLIFIFLRRNISIFYLILYLCALEILPVLILVKYVTGLI